MIGQLYRQRDVTVQVYSRSLVNKSVISILKILIGTGLALRRMSMQRGTA